VHERPMREGNVIYTSDGYLPMNIVGTYMFARLHQTEGKALCATSSVASSVGCAWHYSQYLHA